jgi:acyl-CoA hydrolase
VLAQLKHHRQLRVHAGMVSDGLLGLLQAGALADRSMQQPPVCTGVALGSMALYEAVADPAWVRFAPVSHTHAHATLAALPKLKAINSFLQIDLLGQVNVDVLGGRWVSGVGGLVDFLRGARASVGGLGIVAGTATAGADLTPRIVPLLPPGAVGITRSDVDTVVTEHGAAHLRCLGVQERAQALIRIAAPQHQDALQSAWHTLRRTL